MFFDILYYSQLLKNHKEIEKRKEEQKKEMMQKGKEDEKEFSEMET